MTRRENSTEAEHIGSASHLADRPVAIKILAKGATGISVCVVSLYRNNRFPETVTRSLLLDAKGRATFFGWMPVDLRAITVNVLGENNQDIEFKARSLSYVEMMARLTAHSPKTVWQALRLLAVRNVRGFQFRIVRLFDGLNEPSYHQWRSARDVTKSASQFDTWPRMPEVLVSIAGDSSFAADTIKSLRSQSYPNMREVPDPAERKDLKKLGLECLWIRLPAGMQLAHDAVEKLVRPLVDNPDIVAVYCDEDEIGTDGTFNNPFFKPAWNPSLAKSGWLAPDGAVIRVGALPQAIDLHELDSGQLLLAASNFGSIGHVPIPLVHRRVQRGRIRRTGPAPKTIATKVSVVIPTRDRADLLSVCLEGLFERTRHDGLDVIVVDNDSCEIETKTLFSKYENAGLIRRIPLHGTFNFAKACNIGVDAALHDHILLLNNDVDPLHPEWLDRMVAELEDERVGACGALLLFRDGFTQHAGVTLGAGSVARHSFHFRHPDRGEDLGLISQRRHVSAVTAACLLTRRRLWDAVGGMNELKLSVAFNDVDYCLRLGTLGKKIMWTPYARLTHLESVSRLADNTPEKLRRFAGEERYMHEQWSDILGNDPHYNPNLSLSAGDHILDALPRSTEVRTPDIFSNRNEPIAQLPDETNSIEEPNSPYVIS